MLAVAAGSLDVPDLADLLERHSREGEAWPRPYDPTTMCVTGTA